MADQPKQTTARRPASSKSNTSTTSRKPRKKRNRKSSSGIPVLFKVLLVPALLILSIVAGSIFGYSVVGDGSAKDVFDLKTWKHMYDLIFAPG